MPGIPAALETLEVFETLDLLEPPDLPDEPDLLMWLVSIETADEPKFW